MLGIMCVCVGWGWGATSNYTKMAVTAFAFASFVFVTCPWVKCAMNVIILVGYELTMHE